jgi:hypothetical protein
MALRTVNLVPESIVTAIRVKRHALLWLGVLLVGVLVVAMVFGGAMYRVTSRRRPTRNTTEMEASIHRVLSEVQSVQDELDALSFIDRISARQSYADVLYRLSTLMSTNTWLVELSLNDRGDRSGSKQATMNGYAFSNGETGMLVSHLSNEPLFDAVELKSAEGRDVEDAEQGDSLPDRLVYFQIECVVGGGAGE